MVLVAFCIGLPVLCSPHHHLLLESTHGLGLNKLFFIDYYLTQMTYDYYALKLPYNSQVCFIKLCIFLAFIAVYWLYCKNTSESTSLIINAHWLC